MIKPNFKYSLLLSTAFLAVVIASILTSYFIYREVQEMQLSHDRIEDIQFMRQYEYELLRTTIAFEETYPIPANADSYKSFIKWFNILWSRVDTINKGSIDLDVVGDSINFMHLQQSITVIDRIVYQQQDITTENLIAVRTIFNNLIQTSHNYQLQRDFLYQESSLQRQAKFFEYFSGNFLLHMLILIFGFFVALYLARTNRKLLHFGIKLEELVKERTNKLSITNSKLSDEIEERRLTEERLLDSQAQIERAKVRAENKVNYDSLTLLASRVLFIDRFEQALIRSRRNSTQVALLFLDLDHFKKINDTLGHAVGDQLLKMTAKRISSALREGDTAARFGGDEFALILPDIKTITCIEHIIYRILHELEKPYDLSGNNTIVSASIGITVFPKDGDTTGTLLRKADRAMYKAKEDGRNNFQFFTQQMDDEAHKKLLIETELYKAVENSEFQLYYQTIVSSLNNQIIGAEALIRWPHKSLGMISPDTFIPVAEDTDLILKIGKWVLHTACRDAKRWQEKADKPLTIAVNMSARQFQKQNIPELVKTVLQETGLAAECLILEITERLLIEDSRSTLLQFEELRSIGIGLAIDDFGTGFSSLSYLNTLPISILKIDRSFMQNLEQDNGNIALVRAIISMAFSLNLRVVAEGVETRQQVQFLIDNDCFCCQGFYFSRPLALADFENNLYKSNSTVI